MGPEYKTFVTHGVWDKTKPLNLRKRPFVNCWHQSTFHPLSSPPKCPPNRHQLAPATWNHLQLPEEAPLMRRGHPHSPPLVLLFLQPGMSFLAALVNSYLSIKALPWCHLSGKLLPRITFPSSQQRGGPTSPVTSPPWIATWLSPTL